MTCDQLHVVKTREQILVFLVAQSTWLEFTGESRTKVFNYVTENPQVGYKTFPP
jgi:hypothetical protein